MIDDQERARRTAAAVHELQQLEPAHVSSGADAPEPVRALREELVLANTGVAEAIARRYRNRGMALEELTQAAYVGLVKAANGFDPHAGSDFLAYAVPTMTGEVRRQFRDQGWAVRPPRRLQELGIAISQSRQTLEAALNRSPTVAELAADLGVDEDDVIEALASGQNYHASSLDAPTDSGEGGGTTLGELLPFEDDSFDKVDDLASLRPLLAKLAPRERRILALRYFEELTQQQIGERVGVTQMQVSRLLTRTLTQLREQLLAADDDPADHHGTGRHVSGLAS